MRDWERAQAHYRSAERYAAAGKDDKAASHALRAWQIERQSRFGGLKKDLGRLLFPKKNSDEKQGKHRDDKPVPDVPNAQATYTAATPKWFEPATVDAGKLALFSLDEQDVFDYVLRTNASVEEDPEYKILRVEGMAIYHVKLQGESYVYIAVGDETARAPFKYKHGLRTGEALYKLARALDECARHLQEKGLIDAEKRLFLQRDLMSKVHIAHLRRIENEAYGK